MSRPGTSQDSECRRTWHRLRHDQPPPELGCQPCVRPEQQVEVDNFRKRSAETKKDLKELRRDLRQDADALEFWTKVVNIGAIPLLIILIGGLVALTRKHKVTA